MKKVLPFLFPLAAVLIVIFLAMRWFSMRSDRGQIGPVNEGVAIEDLTQAQRESVMKGTADLKTVNLQPTEPTTMGNGAIRYDIQDGRVLFSVDADLPDLTEGKYQVWVKSGTTTSRAFALELNKGGYMGSASVTEDTLPIEVTVTKEINDDSTMEQVILRGTINK